VRQSVYDLGPPTLVGLADKDVTTNLPVEKHQFTVDSKNGMLLSIYGCDFLALPANLRTPRVAE
jgi:hypothetical protein